MRCAVGVCTTGRMHHASLITGSDGVGKATLADLADDAVIGWLRSMKSRLPQPFEHMVSRPLRAELIGERPGIEERP
jgi:hypothetical protein